MNREFDYFTRKEFELKINSSILSEFKATKIQNEKLKQEFANVDAHVKECPCKLKFLMQREYEA